MEANTYAADRILSAIHLIERERDTFAHICEEYPPYVTGLSKHFVDEEFVDTTSASQADEDLEAKIEELKGEVARHDECINKWEAWTKESLDSRIERQKTKIKIQGIMNGQLKKGINDLITTNDVLSSQNDETITRNTALGAENDRLTAEVKRVRRQRNSTMDKKKYYKKAITASKEENTRLSSEISNLQSDHLTLKSRNDAFEIDNTALQAEITRMNEEIKALTDNNAMLKDKSDSLQTENTALKADLALLQEECNTVVDDQDTDCANDTMDIDSSQESLNGEVFSSTIEEDNSDSSLTEYSVTPESRPQTQPSNDRYGLKIRPWSQRTKPGAHRHGKVNGKEVTEPNQASSEYWWYRDQDNLAALYQKDDYNHVVRIMETDAGKLRQPGEQCKRCLEKGLECWGYTDAAAKKLWRVKPGNDHRCARCNFHTVQTGQRCVCTPS